MNEINTRLQSEFVSISGRTDNFHKSFYPSCIRLWNALDVETRSSPSIEAFRAKLNKNVAKQNKLFYLGKRQLNILHAQLRLNCSPLKSHLHKIGAINDATCACNKASEDVYHFFFSCELYKTQRDRLQMEILPVAPFTLNTILHGSTDCSESVNKSIFIAVQNYIAETKRF